MNVRHAGVALAAFLAVGLVVPGVASAVTITFDGLGPVGEVGTPRSDTEAGFDLLINPIFFVDVESGTDLEMEPRFPFSGGSMEITRSGGGSFLFEALDIQREYFVEGPAFVTLRGFTGAVLMATDTFFTTNSDYETVVASSLAGVAIDKLVMTGQRNESAGIAWNNLEVTTTVPEPGSLLLLGAGLAGLAAWRRRRHGA